MLEKNWILINYSVILYAVKTCDGMNFQFISSHSMQTLWMNIDINLNKPNEYVQHAVFKDKKYKPVLGKTQRICRIH